jgi:hypothetical protein
MKPEITAAIQRAKTCAPAKCGDERICFMLAMEVERLSYELELMQKIPDPITLPEPSYDAPNPLWVTI